jgi:hypothetical protein
MVEEIASDHDEIDRIGEGPIDDALQDAPAAVALLGASVAVEMDVGGVQDAQGPS